MCLADLVSSVHVSQASKQMHFALMVDIKCAFENVLSAANVVKTGLLYHCMWNLSESILSSNWALVGANPLL